MTLVEKRPDRTLGAGHDTFWEWCGKGELRLQRCRGCDGITWPVRQACEHCGGTDLYWYRTSGRGRLVASTRFERDYYRGLLPIPWDSILVELEEGVLFLSNPADFVMDDLPAGSAVRLAFIECEDSAGRFSLPVFRKA